MSVVLSASFPGAHHKEALMIGNPEYRETIADGDVPAAPAWSPTPDLVVTPGAKKRLLLVQTTIEIEVAQVSEGEEPDDVETMPLLTNSGAITAYACLLEAGCVGVYIRTP